MKVLTVGTFDLLHPGHIAFLRSCQKIAGPEDKVIVGLNTDEFIERFKGKPPIQSYEERRVMLQSTQYVWYVEKNDGDEDLKVLIDRLMRNTYSPINALVVGSDWAKKDYYAQTQLSQEYLDRKHIQLIYIPYTENISSTIMKQRILDRA